MDKKRCDVYTFHKYCLSAVRRAQKPIAVATIIDRMPEHAWTYLMPHERRRFNEGTIHPQTYLKVYGSMQRALADKEVVKVGTKYIGEKYNKKLAGKRKSR